MPKQPPAPSEENSTTAVNNRAMRWYLLCSILAIGSIALALYQRVVATNARNETIMARMEADVAKAEVETLRQQLEIERILSAKQLEMLRKLTPPSAADGQK